MCLLDDSVVHVTIFVHILGLVHILGYVYAGLKYCPRVIYRLLRVSPPRASLPSCIVIGLHPSRYRPESPSVLPRFSIARVVTAVLRLSVFVELSVSLSFRSALAPFRYRLSPVHALLVQVKLTPSPSLFLWSFALKLPRLASNPCITTCMDRSPFLWSFSSKLPLYHDATNPTTVDIQ